MTKTTAIDAKRYLTEVSEEWTAFWCHKGPVVRSMAEMSAVLQKMPEATFSHHVNAEKNDLAAWVDAVLGDKEFADDLRKEKTLKATAAAFAARVKELNKCLNVAPKAEKKEVKKAVKKSAKVKA